MIERLIKIKGQILSQRKMDKDIILTLDIVKSF